jgi:hypothetical protein
MVSVTDDNAGGTMHMWRINDLIYRPEDEVIKELEQYKYPFPPSLPPHAHYVPSSFDKRDSVKREKSYKREVFYAFGIISQAECETFSGIILSPGAIRVLFSLPLYEIVP